LLKALVSWVLGTAIGLTAGVAPLRAQTVGVPAHVPALVTGDPAAPDFVTLQIHAAVQRAIVPLLPPGSLVRVSAILPAPQALDRGFQTSFTVPLTIQTGAGSAPLAATTVVDVTNVDLPGFAPETLAFRDDPERIAADGVLSRTTIARGHPERVYYYHENTGLRRRFCVVLSANDSVLTRVHVVGAAAGPNIDVMTVGHSVTQMFLAREPHDEGSVVAIAGGKPYVERDTIVDPGEGIVGSIDLRLLAGGPVTMTVMAIPIAGNPADYLYAPRLAGDGRERHGNFDLAGFAQWIVAYTAGGPDAAYVYGRRQATLPNVDPADAGHDFGDYGVLQRITFDLANPTAKPVTLFLYEKPLGGVVRSSFLVDGTLTDVGCVRVARRYAVTSYELGAHASAAWDVLTMTDGGSNYPLEIGVTATPPLSTTPRISAPDGCFPKPPVTQRSPATSPPAHGSY